MNKREAAYKVRVVALSMQFVADEDETVTTWMDELHEIADALDPDDKVVRDPQAWARVAAAGKVHELD